MCGGGGGGKEVDKLSRAVAINRLASLLKRVLSKMKTIAREGHFFPFPFSVDFFSETTWYAEKQRTSHKSCLPGKTWRIIYQVNPVI